MSEGELPMGEPDTEWTYGDLEAGFADAALVLDESFVTASHSHHSMEPRSCMAYWQDGKCYVFGSTQSQSFVHPGLAGSIGVDPEDLVYVAQYCGGGFGSKFGIDVQGVVCSELARTAGRPVKMTSPGYSV